MYEELVTVVIPIFNVEKHLDRCMESVVNQTYPNLEIIMVDDGSTDTCPQKCEEWARRDDRIKVVHKENAGLGMARNTGIEHASGEYICFFDSDDYISLDLIEKTLSFAKSEHSEIVIFGFHNVDPAGRIQKSIIPNTKKHRYTGEEVQNVFLPDLIGPDLHTGERTDLWMSACACLYSMELIHRAQWRFVSERDIISEDIYSLLCLYKDVNSVSILPEAFYFYCENHASLSHTYRKDRFGSINHFLTSCQQVCAHLGYCEEVMERLAYPYLSNTIAAMKMIVTADLAYSEKRKLIRQIVDDHQMRQVLRQTDIRKESFARKTLLKVMRLRLDGIVYYLVKLKA